MTGGALGALGAAGELLLGESADPGRHRFSTRTLGRVPGRTRPPPVRRHAPPAGPGTPLTAAVAILVAGFGPALAARLPRRALPWAAWVAVMAWTWSLALVDGWQCGIAPRLMETGEYLAQLHRFDDFGPAPRTTRTTFRSTPRGTRPRTSRAPGRRRADLRGPGPNRARAAVSRLRLHGRSQRKRRVRAGCAAGSGGARGRRSRGRRRRRSAGRRGSAGAGAARERSR